MYVENPWRIFNNPNKVTSISFLPSNSGCEKVKLKPKDISSITVTNTKTETMTIYSDGTTKRYYDENTKIDGIVESDKLKKLATDSYVNIDYDKLSINYEDGKNKVLDIHNENNNGNLAGEREDIRVDYSSQDIILKGYNRIKLSFWSENHNHNNENDDY